MALNQQLGRTNPGSKVAYQELSAEDMKDPRLAKLNALLLQISQGVNYALGYQGTIFLVGGMAVNGALEMQGNKLDQVSQIVPSQPLTITGSKGGNAALGSLIAALVSLGLVVDKTT